MPDLRYAGVMFDLGGTLFHDLPRHVAERNQRRALAHAGVDAGPAMAASQLAEAFGRARTSAVAALQRQGFYRHSELVRMQFLHAVQRLGAEASAERLAEAAAQYFALQRSSVLSLLRPRPESYATLAALRDLGCDLSIVSNNDDDYLNYLVLKWRLGSYLRVWLSSDAAGVCKPDPAIFAAGLRGSGLAAGTVLYVGDSLDDDVAGARAAGMDVAWLNPDGRASARVRPTYQIDRLSQLPDLVAGSG